MNSTLIISNLCNNRCYICARAHLQIKEMDLEKVSHLLHSLKDEGGSEVILTGGEVTLRKDLSYIIKIAKDLGFSRLHLQTNGRRFADPAFAELIASEGEFIDPFISIHGHTTEIHEAITGVSNSFDETSRGIDNLISLKIPLRTNTVICEPNYQVLEEIANFLISKGVRNLQFSFIHPSGNALDNKTTMIPEIKSCIPFIKKVLDKNTNEIMVTVEAIPFCLLGNQHCYAAENFSPGNAGFAKIKSEKCNDCIHFSVCPGIWKNYFTFKGFTFLPIPK